MITNVHQPQLWWYQEGVIGTSGTEAHSVLTDLTSELDIGQTSIASPGCVRVFVASAYNERSWMYVPIFLVEDAISFLAEDERVMALAVTLKGVKT